MKELEQFLWCYVSYIVLPGAQVSSSASISSLGPELIRADAAPFHPLRWERGLRRGFRGRGFAWCGGRLCWWWPFLLRLIDFSFERKACSGTACKCIAPCSHEGLIRGVRACILVLGRNTVCLPVCMCMIMTAVPRFVWFGVLLCGEEAFVIVWVFSCLGIFCLLYLFWALFVLRRRRWGWSDTLFLYSVPCSFLQCVAGRKTKLRVYFKARLNSKVEEW